MDKTIPGDKPAKIRATNYKPMNNGPRTRSSSSYARFGHKDFNVWLLLHQARDAVYRARGQELGNYGLTNVEAAVLGAIEAISGNGNQQVTPSEISRWLFRKPHSVSRLVTRMEKRGLVTRTNDLDKKNLVRIAMTDKGHKAYQQTKKRQSIKKVLCCLSEEQRQQFWTCLELVRDSALSQLGIEQEPHFR
ncbi:MAG: MarR family transcriptional regulator [Chloroflexi bacterium]|nr:MarR family transcriptional regulator [Chloroflexota bacterium]